MLPALMPTQTVSRKDGSRSASPDWRILIFLPVDFVKALPALPLYAPVVAHAPAW